MLRNITFSVEEDLIKLARERAAAESTTLNAEFRRWLQQYVERPQSAAEFDALLSQMSYAQSGGKFSRAEMNER